MNTLLFLVELPLCGLALYALWSVVRDYLGMFRRAKSPSGPAEWALLEKGDIPAANPDEIARLKERLSHSCEVHTITEKCTVTSLSEVRHRSSEAT